MNEHSKEMLDACIEYVAFNIYKYHIDKDRSPVFDDESGELYFKTIGDTFSVSVSHKPTIGKVEICTGGDVNISLEIDDDSSTAKNFLSMIK